VSPNCSAIAEPSVHFRHSRNERHSPRSAFAWRSDYLEHELQIMAPRRWRPNLPFRDYRFEIEDWVPAMAATFVRS